MHTRPRAAAGVAALAAASLLATASAGAAVADAPRPIDVQVLALTDLHGYISPLTGAESKLSDGEGGTLTVGGAAYLSTQLDQAAEGRPNSVRVANGDSFTGWQWQVTFTRDEPTVELLDHLGIEASSVGNHELDISLDFLQDHMMSGDCSDGGAADCFPTSTGQPFDGVDFPFLAANLAEVPNGHHPLPSTYVRTVRSADGREQRIGFIGVTTPSVERIFASYQVGRLAAGDMLPAVDAAARDLHRRGVEAVVVLAHEGASHTGAYDRCADPQGPVMDLARQASPLVDVVVGGHWHTAFSCMVEDPAGQPRPVISPGRHGRLFADIGLQLDPTTGDVLRDLTTAHNVPVTRDVEPDPDVVAMSDYWNGVGGQMWAAPHAEVTEDVTATRDPAGESEIGNLVADAYLGIGRSLPGRPPVLALTHPYQVRNPLTYAAGTNPADADGRVLFGESWVVQGRGSSVVNVDVPGRVLRAAFEQQWQQGDGGTGDFAPLSVSAGVHVRLDPSRPAGSRLVSLTLDGREIRDARSYRVAMPSRLALGMDGFSALSAGTRPERSDMDYFAFQQWMASQPPISAPARDRVDATAPVQ